MPDERIEGEVILENKKFTASSKETKNELTDLGQRFYAISNLMSSQSKSAFGQIEKSLKSVEQSFKTSTDGINRHIKNLNFERVIGQVSSLGSKARDLFSNAIGTGAGFETEINKIGSITGASRAQLEQYSESLRKMSGEMNLAATPAQTAATAYEAFSSNFNDINSASEVSANSLKLIADGSASAGDATKLLTGALNAYGATAQDASKFTDILFQTQNFGATTIADLSQSLGLVTSTAAAAGVPFEELAAAMATTTIRGINTSSSVEGLRGLLIKLIDPTKESEEAQKKYGITVNATTLKQKGLLQTLKDIRAAVGNDSQAFNDITGSAQAFQVALALTNDGTAKFSENLDKMRNASGAADKAVRVVSEGFDYSKRQFQAALESFQIGAAKGLLPAATAIVKAGTAMLYVLDKIPQPIKTGTLVLIGMVGALGLAAGAVAGMKLAMDAAGLSVVGLTARLVVLRNTSVLLLVSDVGVAFGRMKIAASGLASTIAATLSPAISGTATFFSAMALSIGAATLAFTGLGLVFGGVLIGLTKIEEEASAAGEALIKSTDLRARGKQIDGNVKTNDILGKTAKQLHAEGVSADTILQNSLTEREGAEQARANGRPQSVIDSHVKKARELRELARQVREYKADEAAITERADEETKTERANAFRDAVADIELSRASHREKIAQYEQLRSRFQLNSSEERQVRRAIDKEERDDAENQAKYLKQLRKDRLADKIQDIENSKETREVKISQLKALIDAYHLVGQERRAVEDKVYQYEQQIQKKREQDLEKQKKRIAALNERKEDRTRDRAETDIKQSERRTREDTRLQETGLDTSERQAKEIQERLKANKVRVDSQARSDVAKETDPAQQQAILEKAARDKRDLEEAAQEEVTNLTRDQGERRLKFQVDMVNREINLQARRADALKAQIETGKGNEYLINDAILKRLDLMVQEIQLQADLAKSRTNDPREAAQIEEDAQARITDARKAARKEIEETNRAIEEQKRKTKENSSKEFSGNILTLDQFIQGERDRFSDDAKKPGYVEANRKRKGALGRLDFQINDATRDQIYNSQPRSREELKGQLKPKDLLRDSSLSLDVGGVIVVRSERGEKLGEVQDLSINGKRLDRQARTLGG